MSVEPFALLTQPLLSWFSSHARYMPWREDPTPYHVWLSEIMLQQTRVSAVIPYYERFLAALPAVEDLAACDDDRLMKLWQGLGYYSRARNLKKAAQIIVSRFGGVFPSDLSDLLSLPGVGEYTAGAIRSIAFGIPSPAVDGNVLRVWTRINGDFSDIAAEETKRVCREQLETLIPRDDASRYTQGLMELGATVCLPNGAPECGACPAAEFCAARKQGWIDRLPVKTAAKPRRVERRVVYFFFSGHRVALRRRPARGLLSGLWEYPQEPEGFDVSQWGINAADAGTFGPAKHIFSHVEWEMTSRVFDVPDGVLPEGFVWADLSQWEKQYAIPAAFGAFAPAVRARLLQTEIEGR